MPAGVFPLSSNLYCYLILCNFFSTVSFPFALFFFFPPTPRVQVLIGWYRGHWNNLWWTSLPLLLTLQSVFHIPPLKSKFLAEQLTFFPRQSHTLLPSHLFFFHYMNLMVPEFPYSLHHVSLFPCLWFGLSTSIWNILPLFAPIQNSPIFLRTYSYLPQCFTHWLSKYLCM